MSIFGKWGYKRLGGKKGLTLIELLIVLVILAILAGVIVLAVGGIFSRTGEQAYNLVRDELQLATTGYMTDTDNVGLPCVNGTSETSVNGTICDVDVCALLGPDELLRDVPDGMRADNCDDGTGTANCSGCDNDNHYQWVIVDGGNVESRCATSDDGSTCDAAGDGYQGQWP